MDARRPWTGHLRKPHQEEPQPECDCACHKDAHVVHVVPCCGPDALDKPTLAVKVPRST